MSMKYFMQDLTDPCRKAACISPGGEAVMGLRPGMISNEDILTPFLSAINSR
jgi:hypothetical protein